MTITEHLNKAQSTLFSFELLPPLKGENIQTIFNAIDPLLEFSPAYINVTYHREEVVYNKGVGGELIPKVLRRRPGTVGIAAGIQHRYNIDVVPHVICGGFSKEETEDALIDFDFLGVNNLLAVRGDADKITGRFEPKQNGHSHAVDLIKQIVRMNQGQYNDTNIESASPTNFCIGVAGYPEKHAEAPNMATDLMHLKAKVDAGAEYIVTQLFFDNKKFFSFVDSCRKVGITVPIIPGLKPISVKEHMNLLPRVFNVDLPEDLVRELVICNNNKAARELGIEWTIQQAKELKNAGVPSIHFYTMGKSDNIARIARAVY
jgi:methylenetetrahydrofolate reductase (NADPH)